MNYSQHCCFEVDTIIIIDVRGDQLSESDQLCPRITEAIKRVTKDDCTGQIKHTHSFFDTCLEKKKLNNLVFNKIKVEEVHMTK